MALSLAACGGSSTTVTTPVVETPVVETPVVETPVVVTPAALTFALSSAVNAFTGGDGADSFTAATAAVLQSFDTLDGGAGTDTLTITDVADAYEGTTGVSGTISNMEGLVLSTSGGVGTVAVAAGSAVTGSGEVTTITPTAPATTFTAHTITINGTDFATSSISSNNTTAKLLGDSLATKITAILGDSVTVGARDSTTGVFTVTAKQIGQAIPDITIAVTGTSAAATATTVAAVGKVATIAAAPIQQITMSGTGTLQATDTYTLNYVSATGAAQTLAYTGATSATAATNVAAAINNIHGSTIASAAGTVVTIMGEVGGTLPLISVGIGGSTPLATAASTIVQNGATAIAASTSESVFDISGFTGDVTLTVADNAVVKAAATAAVTIASSAGSVDVDGGATVNVTGTGAVDIMGDKITSATVKTGTGTGDTVNIGATSGTTADTPLLETASVTGGTTITISDNKNGTSAKTLTTVDLAKIGGTATITGDAVTNVNIGAQLTSQGVIVVNGATADHVLNLTVADTGIDAAAAAQQVEITDDTAKTVALTVNGTDNDILIGGDTSLTTLTVTGAGAAGIALHSSTAVTSIDASAATGNIDLTGVEAVAITVKTGAGDDTFTTAATAAMTVDAGAGDDTVTFGSAVAKGSTVDLGAGDDTLLTSSGSVATDDATSVVNAKITLVDGGSGTDTLAASFITAGNADQFANFEILGLDKTSGSMDSALISGITGLELLAGGGTYTNLDLSDNLTVATTGMSGTTTLTFATAEVSGASDSYTITFSEQNAAERTEEPSSANVAAGTVVTAGVENINIVSGGVFTHNDITLGANGDAETVTITGAQNLDIAFASGFGSTSSPATGVSLIDGSGATGDLAVVLTNVVDTTTGLEVKTGSGDDVITTAAHVTTITTGTGADTIHVGANTPTMTATATAAEVISEMVTITDFDAANDTIDFTTLTIALPSAAVVAVDVTAATSLFDAVGIATTGNGNTNTDSAVAHFEYSGDTYLLFDEATETSSDMDTGDVLVQLTGTGYVFDDAALTTAGVFTL